MREAEAAGIKFTHRPKINFFAAQRRLVAPVHVKLGMADWHVGRLAVQNFTSIGSQNIKNFHLLTKNRPKCVPERIARYFPGT